MTVGSQMPFRRLVRAMDEWARRNPTVEVVAQIGDDALFKPVALRAFGSVSPVRFAELVRDSELVVAHAGMGSVLTALEHCKPMLLMPRRGALKETRNDHQIATLRWLKDKPGIYAADDESQLNATLDVWRARGLTPPQSIDSQSDARHGLVDALREFIG